MKAILFGLIVGIMLEKCAKDITSLILTEKPIGEGSSGSIFKSPKDGRVFKFIKNTLDNHETTKTEIKFMKELSVMKIDGNEITVKYFSDCETSNGKEHYNVIEMEACEETIAAAMIRGMLNFEEILDKVRKMAAIIKTLNDNLYFHRDAHNENFMTCGGKLKVIDYGNMQKWDAGNELTLDEIKYEEAELFNGAQPYTYYRILYNLKIRKTDTMNKEKREEMIAKAESLNKRMDQMIQDKKEANKNFSIDDVISVLDQKIVLI